MMIARRSMRSSALAKQKHQVVSSRFPSVEAPPHRSYVQGGSHQSFQDSRFFSGAGGERRNGPRDWLGLGLPLVWWGVAVVSIGGFFATGYGLATATDGGELAELVRRGSTGAWGAQSQLEALLGLQAEIDSGALLWLSWHLVPVGLIQCISSGVRSSNLQVSEAAWQLAAGLCEHSPTRCKALLHQDLEFTRKSHSSGAASCDGDDNKEATVEGGDGLNRPLDGISGLWSILASDLVVQLDFLASLQANSAERRRLLYRLNGRLRTLAALTTPQGALGGYVGAFQARNSSDRAKYSAQDSQQQQPSSTLFPLPSLLLRAIESPSNFASPSTLSAHNTGDGGGGGKEAAAASIADPRIVWAVVEVLAQCHPELHPTLQSLTSKNGGNSDSSSNSRNSLFEKFRALAETGDTFHGEEEMGVELFAQMVVFKMDELCCQILHNLVLTDNSGAVAEMLAAKVPMNLLLDLAWDDELKVYHPAALALHTTLNHLRASGVATLSSSSSSPPPPSSTSAASRVVLDKIEQTWCPLFRPQTTSSEDSKEKKIAKETAPPSPHRAATASTATATTNESETSCDEVDDQTWLTKFAKELPPLPAPDPYSLDSLLSFHALAQIEAAVDAALVSMVYAPLRRWWQWRRSGEGQLLSQLEHMLNKSGATHTHPSTATAAPANAAAATPPKGPSLYASAAPSASASPSFFSQSHYSFTSSSLSPTLSPSATVRQIPFQLNRSALSLRFVLLRSAASNALAAMAISMLYGVHGQMDDILKHWERAHDESENEYRDGPLTSTQVAAALAKDAAITVSELAVFGAVIRVAPFCVFPCVWAYYSNEHNK